MIEIALLLTISWTNPSTLQGVDGCGSPSHVLLTDLKEVRVTGQQRGSTNTILLGIKNVEGHEGQRDTLTVDLPAPGQWTITLVTIRSGGAVSCPRYYGVGQTLDVPERSTTEVVWYDVAGRRMKSKPTLPGIYWRLEHGRTRQVVIIP